MSKYTESTATLPYELAALLKAKPNAPMLIDAVVQNDFTGHGCEIDREFFRLVLEKGGAAVVKFRKAKSDETITQV